MSKRLSSKTKKLVANEDTQANGNQCSDTLERRRIQNRLAQRNHRKKVRDHINALEARVIKSMLQRPSPFGIPLSTPSNYTDQNELYTQPFHTSDPNYEYALEFDSIENTYSNLSGAQSPGTCSQPSDGPNSPRNGFDDYSTPATSCLSLPLTSRSNSVSGSRTTGVTFDLITSFPDAQIDPHLLCQMESSLSLMDTSGPPTYHKHRTSSMPESQTEFTMRLFSKDPPISPKLSAPRYPHTTEPILMRHFPPHTQQTSANESSSWTPEIPSIDEESTISTTLSGEPLQQNRSSNFPSLPLQDFLQTRHQTTGYEENFPVHQGNPYFLNPAPEYDRTRRREQIDSSVAAAPYCSAQKAPFEQMSIYRSPSHF